MTNEATKRELDTPTSWKVLFFNTLAFTICFAAWMMKDQAPEVLRKLESDSFGTPGWQEG